MAEHFFIFGAGYSGLAITDELRRLYGQQAFACGTARSESRLPLLRAAGIAPFLFSGEEFCDSAIEAAAAKQALREAEYCIISIPPQKGACSEDEITPSLASVREALDSGKAKLKSLVYLSTIGVYGDARGAWLDEESPLRATSPQSIARIRAESAWTELCRAHNLSCLILRLGGIYGGNLAPQNSKTEGFAPSLNNLGLNNAKTGAKSLSRSPFVRLAAETARRIIKAGQVSNRIHAADIGGAVCHLLAQKADGIYNLCDGNPAPPQDIIAFAAELMGIEPPAPEAFETAEISPALRGFYLDNRRISNAKLRASGYQFRYPDYKAGLTAIWQNSDW